MSYGYNKTPSGFDNKCEEKNGDTKWYVLHAEANAILKLSYSSLSCEGSTIYVTHFPCQECCKLIYQSRIRKVIYLHNYTKKDKRMIFLNRLKIKIKKLQ
ncbi:deoxycytidylate deaminase [Blattabacterium cuenoti]|uniref:deoxycytidylate deaminase n=1 Tax=Blattabacterium cuenoti TaxID=1653831 RepID=UPI00293BB5BE|nr:deaminase [Blattabacterium cuenoti]